MSWMKREGIGSLLTLYLQIRSNSPIQSQVIQLITKCVCLEKETKMIAQKVFNGTQTLLRIKYTNQSTLLQLLQSIFDDITIYNDDTIRTMVTKSDKGFVSLEQIMSLPMFKQFVERNPDIYLSPEELCRVVREESKKLVAVNFRIKRIKPFVDNIANKVLKAIYVERLPNKPTSEVLQFFKGIVGKVYQIYHKKNQRWVIILIENYQALNQVKEDLYYQDKKLKVMSPIQTLMGYGQNQRLNSDFNILKLYENKNIYEIPEIEYDDNKHTYERQQREINQANHRYHQGSKVQDQDQDQDFFDQFQEMVFHEKKMKNNEYMRHFQSREMRQKAMNLQMKRNIERQLQSLYNFDNTPLLLLRGNKNNQMME